LLGSGDICLAASTEMYFAAMVFFNWLIDTDQTVSNAHLFNYAVIKYTVNILALKHTTFFHISVSAVVQWYFPKLLAVQL
jgi:hypothetical protein